MLLLLLLLLLPVDVVVVHHTNLKKIEKHQESEPCDIEESNRLMPPEKTSADHLRLSRLYATLHHCEIRLQILQYHMILIYAHSKLALPRTGNLLTCRQKNPSCNKNMPS